MRISKTPIALGLLSILMSAGCSALGLGERAQLAKQLVGMWRAGLGYGITEEWVLSPLNSNGEGRFEMRQSRHGKVTLEINGYWRLWKNRLVSPKDQIQFGWDDKIWGRRRIVSLIIQEIDSGRLVTTPYLNERLRTDWMRVRL